MTFEQLKQNWNDPEIQTYSGFRRCSISTLTNTEHLALGCAYAKHHLRMRKEGMSERKEQSHLFCRDVLDKIKT